MFKLFFIAALLIGALGVAVSSTAQQALADKAAFDDRNKQGGVGEYFSKDGRDTYYGGASGQEFGEQRSTYARPGDQPGGHESFGVQNNGANTAYYASGECHSRQPCE